jgi:small-conductance mechanosensitive channel
MLALSDCDCRFHKYYFEGNIMKCCIKLTLLTALLGATAVFSTGCQNQQLENCQQENLRLQKTIDQQQKQIEQFSLQQETLTQVMLQITAESDKVEKQLTVTEKELEKLKRLRKMQEMSPEKKAKMIKSIEELKKARKIKAEKMKKQQQEKK